MKKLLLSALIGAYAANAAAEPFQVQDIRVEGLQRVSAGTVFASLPINIGSQVDSPDLRYATRQLFATGLFQDVEIIKDGGVLVFRMRERPSIESVELEGNKAIKDEDLMTGMIDSGLAEGEIFKQATLEALASELERQYFAQGRYSASVQTEVEDLPQNRVKLKIIVDEGSAAAIKHINIVGNELFSDEELAEQLELKTSTWLSWFDSKDKYAREKLQGDLDKLSSYYLDRGYLQFNVESTQVSLSPSREEIFITINVDEGEKYTVNEVALAGDLVIAEETLRRLILVREDTTFSQVLMTTTSDYMTQLLGNSGYTFAEVRGIPEVNEEDKTVKVTFFVDPGDRAYVRRVEFRGNTTTADEVLRREMRQLESAPASTARIEQGKIWLERLGYFKNVQVETKEVPGTTDQIDVEYSVEEQPSGSIGGNVGYAEGSGLILGANLQQNNFLGTGKRVGVNLSYSDYQQYVSFDYTDPYFTPDGVSRGFNVFVRERNLERIYVASYSTNNWGANANFGWPISDVERIGVSFGYLNTQISVGPGPAQEISATPGLGSEYLDVNGNPRYVLMSDIAGIPVGNPNDPADPNNFYDLTVYDNDSLGFDPRVYNTPGFIDVHGNEFSDFKASVSWSQSTLNRGQLATRGMSQSLALETTIPGSDLSYFKLTYSAQYFKPLFSGFTLRLKTRLGYGEGWGDTKELPFFENFYSGGFNSVRGFKRNTLGPRTTPAERYTTSLSSRQWNDANGDGIIDSGELTQDYANVILDSSADQADWMLQTEQVYQRQEEQPLGGNVVVEGTAELLFPLPFVKDQRSMQTALFVDVGNVFDTTCYKNSFGQTTANCFEPDFNQLRASVGIGLTWISGFGPLSFALSAPINETDIDEVETFQFSMGQTF